MSCQEETVVSKNSNGTGASTQTAEQEGCVDNCCPSIVVNEQGEKSLYIPPASIVTTLGGLCLIIVHAANLCCCRVCDRRKKLKVETA